jgi:putative membrane protein
MSKTTFYRCCMMTALGMTFSAYVHAQPAAPANPGPINPGAQSGTVPVAPTNPGAADVNNPGATSESKPGTGVISGSTTVSDSAVSDADRAFAQQAVAYAKAQIEAGRLALADSKTPKVQAFAKQAVDTGERSLAPLKKFTQALNITIADSDAKANEETQQLKAAKGTVFDGLYGQLALNDEQQALALYSKEADSGSNGQLKSFAALEKQHTNVLLNNAQQLRSGTVDRSNPNCAPNAPARMGCP